MKISEYEKLVLNEGEVIFKEGQSLDFFFLVKAGEVISLKSSANRLLPTGIHTKGSFLGGVNAIKGSGACESAIARTACTLIPIPLKDFKGVLSKCNEWTDDLLKNLFDRLEASLNLMAEHKIADDLSEYSESYTDDDEALYRNKLGEFKVD